MKKQDKVQNILFFFLNSIVITLLFLFFIYNQKFYLLQSVFFLLTLNIPIFFQIFLHFKFTLLTIIIYELFLIAHFIFGEILSFYTLIRYYDVFLHFATSFCICLFSFSIIHTYLKIFLFNLQIFIAFLISITSEFIWEIIEFFIDEIFSTNMQRYINNIGILLNGHNALQDTIKDMFTALIAGLFFVFAIKYKKLQRIKVLANKNVLLK